MKCSMIIMDVGVIINRRSFLKGIEILAKYDDYTDKPVTYCTQRIVYVCKKKNEQEKEEK